MSGLDGKEPSISITDMVYRKTSEHRHIHIEIAKNAVAEKVVHRAVVAQIAQSTALRTLLH